MNKVETKQDINNLLNEFIEAIHFYDKDEANALFAKVELIDRESIDPSVLDKLELYIFRYYLFVHDYCKAKELVDKLAERYQHFDIEDQYIYNCYKAIYEISNKNFESSIEVFYSLLEGDSQYKLPTFIKSDIYYHLCWGYTHIDDYKRSVVYGNKALDLYLSEFNLLRIIYTQMLLLICHSNLGFYNEADELYKHLIRNTKIVNLYHLIPHIDYNHCVSLVNAGEYSEAINKAKILLKSIKSTEVLYIMTLITLVEAKLMNREKTEVQDLLNRVKEISMEKESLKKWYLISIYYEKKLSSEYDAFTYLTETLAPFLIGSNDKKALYDITKVMGDYFIKQRNYELASSYYELNLSLN